MNKFLRILLSTKTTA